MLRHEIRFWAVRIFLVCFLVFMVNRLFFFSSPVAESTLSYVLYPCIKLQHYILRPIASYITKHRNMKDLHQQYVQLLEENDVLHGQITSLLAQKEFQQQTEEVRRFAKRYKYQDKLLVKVLQRNFDDRGHFYFIDAGLKDGVFKNMVAVYKNNIVGRVVEVMPLYSKVVLVTDEQCKIAVFCKKAKAAGIYQGHNTFDPTVQFVPHYHILTVGDAIITSGQGLIFPEGFCLGKVKDLRIEGVSYTITVQPFIDLKKLDYMYLITL